jgi:DNA-binding IscR family transcriptional regulator
MKRSIVNGKYLGYQLATTHKTIPITEAVRHLEARMTHMATSSHVVTADISTRV